MKANILRKGKTSVILSLFILLGVSGLFLQGCYPGDPLSPADTDVVTTFYEKGTDFSSKSTYTLADSVVYITGDGEFENRLGAIDRQILERIEQNMEDAGYELDQNPQNADVAVAVAITSTTWVSGGCYPYWGWWYPYPGWCYPYAYSWSTGSIIILMSEEVSGEADVVWFAGINGIIEGSSSSTSSRINNNIDQAFDQSPYLADGK